MNWTLVQSLLWPVLGSLSRLNSYVCVALPQEKSITQHLRSMLSLSLGNKMVSSTTV